MDRDDAESMVSKNSKASSHISLSSRNKKEAYDEENYEKYEAEINN